MEISLEKVDLVKDRTGCSYREAKEALELCKGDVLEAIIFVEENFDGFEYDINVDKAEMVEESLEDFKDWLKDSVKKGNVARVAIKKDEKVLADVPVNAGIAATVIAVVLPPVLACGVIAAVATKVTIEITKTNGEVEVVNKYIKKATNQIKDKATTFAYNLKGKVGEVKDETLKNSPKYENTSKDNSSTYTYTMNFDEE